MNMNFTGIMMIHPVVVKPFPVAGEWEYKPEFNCWYCNGESFPAAICEKVEEW